MIRLSVLVLIVAFLILLLASIGRGLFSGVLDPVALGLAVWIAAVLLKEWGQ